MKKRPNIPKRAPAAETRKASEAVEALTASTLAQIGQQVEALAQLALRDAKLDPADGWRYDAQRRLFVRPR